MDGALVRGGTLSGGVRRSLLLFFHETVPAQELEQGVGAARGGTG